MISKIRPLIIVVTTAAVYFRGLFGGLLLAWDDDRFIVDSDVTNNVSIDSLISIFTNQHFEAYHPLHLLSYWLDVPWFGHDGPAIHIVSLCLWIIVLLVLLRLFDRLGLSPIAALFAVLFFGLHPVQVEAVTWATGRKDILAALFSCLSIYCHVGSVSSTDRNSWLTRVFYLLAALSKTTVLPLPGVLFLYDLLVRRRGFKRSLMAQVPLLLVGVALSVIVVLIWRQNVMIRPDTIAGPATRVAASITHHVLTALAPLNTAAVYPVNRPEDFAWTAYVIPVFLLGVLGLSIRFRKYHAVFVISSFLILLLPVSNIVPMYWHWMDRYLSLPLLPIAYGFGLLLTFVQARRQRLVKVAAFSASLLLIAAFSARTAIHHIRYTDEMSLWEYTSRSQPDAFHAWKKYGERLIEARRPKEAIEAFTRAIDIEPASKLAHANLLQAYSLGDEESNGLRPSRIDQIGVRYLRDADDPDNLRRFAALMDSSGYVEGTRFLLKRALELSPMSSAQMTLEALRQKRLGNRNSHDFYMNLAGLDVPRHDK